MVEAFIAPGITVGSAVRRFRSPAWVTGDTASSLVLVRESREPVASRVGTDTAAPDSAALDSGVGAEQRLGLTRAERATVQRNLTALGHDTHGVDGIFGLGTRTALRGWQRANDLTQTGYLTSAQVPLLNQQTAAAAAPPQPQAENGVTAPALADARATEAALGLTHTDRVAIEQRLAVLGFAPGQQDGSFDGDTRWAIEGYQRNRGHGATGYLDRPTVAAVMRETRDASTGIPRGADVLINILRGLGE